MSFPSLHPVDTLIVPIFALKYFVRNCTMRTHKITTHSLPVTRWFLDFSLDVAYYKRSVSVQHMSKYNLTVEHSRFSKHSVPFLGQEFDLPPPPPPTRVLVDSAVSGFKIKVFIFLFITTNIIDLEVSLCSGVNRFRNPNSDLTSLIFHNDNIHPCLHAQSYRSIIDISLMNVTNTKSLSNSSPLFVTNNKTNTISILNSYIIKMVTDFNRSYNHHQTIKIIKYYTKII
jgi:hypothetical protein